MFRRFIRQCCFLLLLTGCLLPVTTANAHTTRRTISAQTPAPLPIVDPDYTYNQLFYLATHFLKREAGYDTQLPPTDNGHDEFADYWSQEMQRNLQGFGAQVTQDAFTIQGWTQRPVATQARNIEVSIPGLTHPEQVVIIGCHYDAEAISTQSANDDTSGCAIELGIARAMASYWRTQHVYPTRTLRFVLYDAEEQGLFGSFHAVGNTISGDLHTIVAMFNEEQSGITYPLRYLGQLANPLMPSYIEVPPLQNNNYYPHQDALTSEQRQHITSFRALLQQAIPAVFQQFRAMGYDQLTYHDGNGQDTAQDIFTDDQQRNVIVEDDAIGSSDQMPFTLAGLPAATFVGNDTFYQSPLIPGSYPYDQTQDTIQLMNTFANGSSHTSIALTLSLALPAMLTTWMLTQPAVLGQAVSDHLPIATISDIGALQVGQPLALNALASFDPTTCTSTACTATDLTYTWDFGDATPQTTSSTITHTYARADTFTLTLTVHSPSGIRRISKTLEITTQPDTLQNPYQGYQATGSPQAPTGALRALPTPNDTLTDRAPHRHLGTTTTPTPTPESTTPTSTIPPGIFVIIAVLAAVLISLAVIRRSKKTSTKTTNGS